MSTTAFGPDLSLTPSQEDFLHTALSSNEANSSPPQNSLNRAPNDPPSYIDQIQQYNGPMANGTNMYTSPIQKTPGSGQFVNPEDSPFLDYENLDDGNFDWDNSGDQLFGDLPGTDFNDEGEHHDKRKASNDEEDDEEASSKRREGDDKTGKKLAQKPGRKPLTGEPTTKRKAQNRAAQRAFRERKERHLKDLETKVDDLEKASETTNHENGRLRATVDKLQTELKEYRKRLSLNVSGASYSPPLSATQSRGYNSSNTSNDFSFAFPKFGDLPGSYLNNGSIVKTTSPPQNGQRSASSSNPSLPGAMRKESTGSTKAISPTSFNGTASSFSSAGSHPLPTESLRNSGYGQLEGLFSPSVLEFASRSNSTDYMTYPGGPVNDTSKKQSTSSANGSSQVPNVQSTSITGSPSTSSMSQALDSSCGTTPESSADSPDHRKGSENVLNTINEESKTQDTTTAFSNNNNVKSPVGDTNGFDWMAQQNGGQFDPVLFGDYRDPQDNILNNAFGDYFNDAFPPINDFASPYNTGDTTSQPPKKDFMKEIEVARNGSPREVPSGEQNQNFLTCDKLWDRVQTSEKAQFGGVDMDDLCSQLKAKAKCSGKGAVIDQKEVDKILGPAPAPAAAEQTDFFKMLS